MKILFLCVANSARSQIAEGLAKQILKGKAEVMSAGSQPSGKVNPFAVHAMAEIGIDLSSHSSKSWETLPKRFFNDLDYVVTLCAEEICPVIPTKAKKLNWGMTDPAAAGADDRARLNAFRETRDKIEVKLKEFTETILL